MKVSKKEIIFFLFYGLLIIWRVLLDSEYAELLGLEKVNFLFGGVIIVGFSLQILITKTTLMRITALLCMWGMAAGIAVKSHIFMIFLITTAVVSSWNIEFKKIVKFSYTLCMFLLFLIVFSSLVGFIPNNIYNTSDTFTNQYCMGFQYFTALPSLVLYLIIMRMYLKKTISSLELLVYAIIFIALFLIAEVLLNLMLGFLLIVGYIIIVKWKIFDISKKKNYRLAGIVGLSLILLILYMVINFDVTNDLISTLNVISNNRLFYSNKGIAQYGIKLLGNYIPVITSETARTTFEYFFIDIGYSYYLLNFGVIGFLGFTGALLYIFSTAAKRNDQMIFLWCVIVIVECCVGRTFDSIWRNPLMFCTVYYIAKDVPHATYKKIKILV